MFLNLVLQSAYEDRLMGDVIDITAQRPHISGPAVCLQCGYTWSAVALVGTTELQCPECKAFKGAFEGFTIPEKVRICECGNEHFYLEPEGAMCALCGEFTKYEDI